MSLADLLADLLVRRAIIYRHARVFLPDFLSPVVDRLGIYKSRFLDAKHILSWPAQTNRFRCISRTPNFGKAYMGWTAPEIEAKAMTFRKYGDLIDYGLGRGPRPSWLPPPTGPFASDLLQIKEYVSPVSFSTV